MNSISSSTRVFLVSIFSLLILTSCGKKGSQKNTLKPTTISQEQIEAIMANQIMDCDAINDTDCPAGIARVLVLDSVSESAVCSGFMVNSTTLITNYHCIPNPQKCASSYVAIYNGNGGEYVSAKCKSVKAILKDYEEANDPRKKLDVAVVQLDVSYHGPVFTPSAVRPVSGEKVTAWVVDHTGLDQAEPNNFESRITELKCYISSQTARQSMVLARCPAISGNSGSPVVNESGEVIGIIWGATGTHLKSTMSLNLRRSLTEEAAATEVIFFQDYFLD